MWLPLDDGVRSGTGTIPMLAIYLEEIWYKREIYEIHHTNWQESLEVSLESFKLMVSKLTEMSECRSRRLGDCKEPKFWSHFLFRKLLAFVAIRNFKRKSCFNLKKF